MENIKQILKIVPVILIVSLTACNRDQKITDVRGKVKLETIHLSRKVPGRVLQINIQEGQQVKKGDTLLVLDIPEVEAKYKQAEGAVQAAQGQLQMAYNGATPEQIQQIEGKLAAAKAQLSFAETSYKRIKNMYEQKLVPHQKYDEVKMKFQMAQAQVAALKAKQKQVLKGTRKEKVDQAQGQLKMALGKLAEAKTALKEKYLIAPQDMQIEGISIQKGELATPGYTLMTGYLPEKVYIRLSIPESKIHQYKVNQKLRVVNPYTHKEFDARIAAIKQLPRYADITAPSEAYGLTESVYELKLIPVYQQNTGTLYQNATVLIK